MKIIIEVDEKVYRNSIRSAWNKYFDENLGLKNFKKLDKIEDFYRVIHFGYLEEDDIKSLKITRGKQHGYSNKK